MKEQYKTWSAVKTYQVSEFIYQKIGLEDTFPKTMSDDECNDEIERRIEAQARRKYPHIFQQEKPFVSTLANIINHPSAQKHNEKTNGNEQPEDNFSLLDRINNSKSINELKSWELLVKVEKESDKKTVLQAAYNVKMERLQDAINQLNTNN